MSDSVTSDGSFWVFPVDKSSKWREGRLHRPLEHGSWNPYIAAHMSFSFVYLSFSSSFWIVSFLIRPFERSSLDHGKGVVCCHSSDNHPWVQSLSSQAYPMTEEVAEEKIVACSVVVFEHCYYLGYHQYSLERLG